MTIYLLKPVSFRRNLTIATGLVAFFRGSGRFWLEISCFFHLDSVGIQRKRNGTVVEWFRLTALQVESVGNQRNRSNDDRKGEDFTGTFQ